MTDEEKSIACAMMCPTVLVRMTGSAGWNYNNSVVGRVLPCINGDPLKDLNAAIELCNILAKESWHCHAMNDFLGSGWQCIFSKSGDPVFGKISHLGNGDTLAQAIYDAFLKVKGLLK